MQLENSKTEKIANKNSYFVRKYKEKSKYTYRPSDGSPSETRYFLPDGGVIQYWDNDMTQYQWRVCKILWRVSFCKCDGRFGNAWK